ncbi:MAG: hypothetical protein WDZ51_08100 [Pirellulaceae bacterium]
MFRDKDYVQTIDHLTFSVLGYYHPEDGVTAGLKYINGNKWTCGYFEAQDFLAANFPHYVTDRIIVPRERIARHFHPHERFAELMESPPHARCLHRLALDLAKTISDQLEIPLTAFGLTDSLLWGEGGPQSDIDLVIYGTHYCGRFYDRAESLWLLDQFQPEQSRHVQRPPHLTDADFQRLCLRKFNQGHYQGVRYCVRGVLEENEFGTLVSAFSPCDYVEQVTTITDCLYSLMFPVVYGTAADIPLVSFHVGYEGTLRPGDHVAVRGTMECNGQSKRMVVGSTTRRAESIRLIV